MTDFEAENRKIEDNRITSSKRSKKIVEHLEFYIHIKLFSKINAKYIYFA